MITNKEIAQIFSKTADLMEIKGENPFKVRAYRNAARIIENSSKDFNKLVKEGFDLTRLPGIGKDLSEYIKEIVTTGEFSKLKELQSQIPQGLVEMLSIEGLGPKRVKQIYDAFHVTSLEELRKFANSGKLDELPGFGPKLIEKILKGIKQLKKAGIRFLYSDVEEIAEDLRKYLLNFPGVEVVEIAGSYRRKKESVGDLDILVVAKDYAKVSEYFVKYKRVKEVHSAGLTRSTVFLDNDLQVDLRAVSKESYGAALHYFTGSKAHNIEIRKRAIEFGLKINEYGVYKGDKKIAGESEEEVYKSVGLCFIEPELRENRGEIEACIDGKLPKLVNLEDIKGDLNVKTKNIKATIKKAINLGYEYIGITRKAKNFLEFCNKIDNYQKEFKEIKLLKVLEIEVGTNTKLDIDDKILRQCDLVVATFNFDDTQTDYTQMILNIIKEYSFVTLLSHLSGRIINKKDALRADYDLIFATAAKHNKVIEIDANPKRLDINDVLIKQAINQGVKLSINSNATIIDEMNNIKYGVYQARRGWAQKENILNSYSIKNIKGLINV